jgi:hypothetical protein
MTNQEIADEIAQIERELEILRSRQALMARWNRVTKVFLAITIPVIAILPIAATFAVDIFVGIFIIAISALAAIALWIINGKAPASSDQRRPSQFPPVGASISPPGFGALGFCFGLGPSYKSDAETIGDMIVLRKRRLAELKGEPPPSVPSVSSSVRTTDAKPGRSKR